MRVLAWPATSSNPYIAELYGQLVAIDPDIEVEDFRPLTAWRNRADVVHVHWPEIATQHPSLPRAMAKSALVLATLARQRRQGAVVVWTCHNLEPHEIRHRRLDRLFRSRFEGLVDGVVHLSESSRAANEANPRLAAKATVVAPHGRYAPPAEPPVAPAEARLRLGLDPEIPVLATVGMIRPYKQVPELIRAFGQMSTKAQLLVAGQPQDEACRDEVADAGRGIGRVRIDDRWLTDQEVTLRIQAADAVVLGYREVHNSGVAILALGLDRPVAVTPAGSMLDLADAVGADWAHLVDQPLSGQSLDRVLAWAAEPRTGDPDLSSFSPALAAERTLELYRRLAP